MTDNSTVDADSRPISYVEEGEGPVALVLVADGGLDGDPLSVVSHYLAEEAGFHVVRVGTSSDSESFDERVADVTSVLDRLGLEHTWIGGHGSGGTVARAFAATHADRVNGLLLLGVEEAEIPLAPVIPVLIIQGTEDEVTPPANGEALRSTAPERASVKNIEGAGHLFPLTHIMDTAVLIEEYLDWD